MKAKFPYDSMHEATNITRPSQITPRLLRDDVLFTTRWRGYDADEVDGVLDQAANRIDDLERDNDRLTRELVTVRRENDDLKMRITPDKVMDRVPDVPVDKMSPTSTVITQKGPAQHTHHESVLCNPSCPAFVETISGRR